MSLFTSAHRRRFRGERPLAIVILSATLFAAPAHATIGNYTRSVTRTVAASNSSADSQAEADYLCTGTNDQTQIQAALDSLPTDGGKVVLLEGTFNISGTIRIEKDSTTLEGQGTGQRAGATQTGIGTKLLAATGLTGSLIRVQTAANTRPVYGAILQHFTVDGGSPRIGTAVDGILFRSNGGKITQVDVHNMSGSGVRVQGYSTWETYDSHLSHLHSTFNLDAGVFFDSYSGNTHLISSVLSDNNDNVHIKADAIQLTSNALTNATRYNVYFDNGGARSSVVANKIEGAGNHGIFLVHSSVAVSHVEIIGNGFRNNGDSGVGVADHINTTGGVATSGLTIVGNNFATDVTNKTRYAIDLDSASDSVSVQANDVSASHNNTPVIKMDGAIGYCRNNVGFATEAQGTATIASASTSVVVTHGLSATPAVKNITVTPTNNLGSAAKYWISNPTATQFTINVNAAPGAATATFAWTAAIQ